MNSHSSRESHADHRTRASAGLRRSARYTGVVLGVFVVIATLALAVRPELHRTVTYRFETHAGDPSPGALLPLVDDDLPTVRLAVAGDVGTGGPAEFATAAAMDDVEGDVEYDALLLLGDNVYPDGDPSEVDRVVLDPFGAVLDGPTQLLPVLGNHDIRRGNADAQVRALGMPGRWYATQIDDVLVLSLDSNRPNDPEQLAWLEEALSTTSATWKIATLHHPPYSGGYHGSDLRVRDAFSPLFERYGVQLVLAGHDHDYQRSTSIEGVTYVVSGGAAALRPARRAEFSEAAWSTYHFVDIAIWPDRLELRAVDQSGDLIDAVTIDP